MNKLFVDRTKSYFGDRADEYLNLLKQDYKQGFFLNTLKANKEDILKLIDFKYETSNFHPNAYFHNEKSIGKTFAYELGLIYPQDAESSYASSLLNIPDPKLIVDLCAAPGGKTIDLLNKYSNAFCIANDVNHKRALELAKNLERLGLDNTIVTSKKPAELLDLLQGNVNLVVLDVPCSGEGMIRKYPEILDDYSIENIKCLANIQKELLDVAYNLINKDGYILYSTCTYAFEEDEFQIQEFLENHSDTSLITLESKVNFAKLDGTVKLSPLNGTEGQFFCLLQRNSDNQSKKLTYLKSIKNQVVDHFISNNLNINEYFLYKNGDSYYMALNPLLDLRNNVIRNGIYLGDITKGRFEPNHNMYRSNSLKGKYRFVYDLSVDEYEMYIKGLEIKKDLEDGYYLITYKNHSLGFGKVSNGIIKNKYPKGLRRL